VIYKTGFDTWTEVRQKITTPKEDSISSALKWWDAPTPTMSSMTSASVLIDVKTTELTAAAGNRAQLLCFGPPSLAVNSEVDTKSLELHPWQILRIRFKVCEIRPYETHVAQP
jgi:hypothetical protein